MYERLPSVAELLGDVSGEALVVFDPASGELSLVNAAAAKLFGLEVEALAKKRAADLLPEFRNPVTGEFTAKVLTARGERLLAVRLERLRTGSGGGAILAALRFQDGAGQEAEARVPPLPALPALAPRTRRPQERLESLWNLVVRRGFTGADQVRAILREAAKGLALERATLACVEDDELAIEFEEPAGEEDGERVPIASSPARAALVRSGTFAALDIGSDGEFSALGHGVRAFLATAFRVGEQRWTLTFTSPEPRDEAFDDDDWRYVDTVTEALSRGIERRERDDRVERLAYSDSLTSLPNRAALLSRLDEAISEADHTGGQASVLFLDIDGFKGVNDTVGHRGGDAVLADVAHRLRSTLRRGEYIGRLGGDEFAVVMPRMLDRAEIESVAHRISAVLTHPFIIDEYRFSLSASIGVAIYPQDATTRDDLLACADAAMYSAKDDGGSRVRFRDATGGFEEPANPGNADEGETHDPGYALCFQPIVEVASGNVIGAEALIRRVHPLHGLLAPERGWSIARDEAGARALDRWVLRGAAAQARAWHDAGISLRLDVNLAAFDRREIDALLSDEVLSPDLNRLRIEVSPERLADGEQAAAVVDFIEYGARHGIGFVLDGFDGGLGALSSLSQLPIEAVKLERPLAENVGNSRAARAVVDGTIIVAKSLGWRVIAKGVETSAQDEALRALGCDAMQGFFIAHPMTATDFVTWLHDRNVVSRQA